MKNYQKLFLLFVSILMGYGGLYAQNAINVKGTVTDAATGEVLPGVTIILKGSSAIGTATDADGNYSISLPSGSGAVLQFSYLGYVTQSISVQGKTTIDAKLTQDTKALSEVVVIGYGTMKRSDLTGAISSIGEKAIKAGVNTSIEQAMQGRMAGVQVMQNSGQPGGGISVAIRGINSMNGNEPLYVIDGVAISGQTSSNLSVLSSISPADITSVEVLKDASASAIYGSRASNGVVLITTKRGEISKPKISYDGYVGWQQIPKQVPVMDLQDYADYYNVRASVLGWGTNEAFLDKSLLGNGPNWQGQLFRTALMNDHHVSISGGTKDARYMLSGGFLNQDGIAIASGLRRATFRVNFDTDITKWLSAGVNASYSNTKQVTTLDDAGLIRTALSQRPDVPPYNLDGTYGFVQTDQFNTYFSNPLYEAQQRERYNTGSNFNYNAYADIKPIKGLDIRIEYGGNQNYGNNYAYQPYYTYGTVVVESQSTRGSSKYSSATFKTYANYDFELAKKHHFTIMAGHEATNDSYESLSGSRKGYISNEIHALDVGDASTATNSNGGNSSAMESWLGRLFYNFADRYMLTATIRRDGSSKLGPDNRWNTAPSLSLAWRINNEAFMKNVTWMDNLKLRLGWGIVGNQSAGNYAYGTTMGNTNTAWGTGYYPGNFGNPKLQWEQTSAYNLGLDLNVLKNRIEFIAEAYYKNTNNLMMPASLPTYVVDPAGYSMSAPWVNVGAMNNKGIEFTLNTVNIDNKTFSWNTNITLSFNRNKITKLYTSDSQLFGRVNGNVYTVSQIGQPVGMFYAYNVIGMFTKESDFYTKDKNGNTVAVPRPLDPNGKDPVLTNNMYPIAANSIWVGDYIYEDVNGDGVIDANDRKVLGNPNPKYTFGINNAFTYKDFELSFFFNGSVGNDIYNLVAQSNSDPNSWGNHLKTVANFARIGLIDPNGSATDISNVYITNAATATVQHITTAGTNMNDNNRISSRFIEDGSYIRLKSLSLSYSLPKLWMNRAGIDRLQVYVNAQNLLTFSHYSGYDPEVGAQGQNVTLMGIDNGRYPQQRIYTLGLRINF